MQAGAASGPGLLPKAVQKMWGVLDPPVSRDYHRAQPGWAGKFLCSASLAWNFISALILSLPFTKPVQCGCKATSGEAALNAAWFCSPRASPLPSPALNTALPVCRQRLSLWLGSYNWKSSSFPSDSLLALYNFPVLTGKGRSLKTALRSSAFSSCQHTKLFTRTAKKPKGYRKSELRL